MASAKLLAMARARRLRAPLLAGEPDDREPRREPSPWLRQLPPPPPRRPEPEQRVPTRHRPARNAGLALIHLDRNRRGSPESVPAREPYSLLVVLNESYRKFGAIFLNSLSRNADMSLVRKLYVGDVGLSAESRREFKRYDKVEVIDTKVNTDFIGIHADEWLRSVAVKSRLLLDLVKRDRLPICMIDADSLVVQDFSHVLDPGFDIQVCQRRRRVRRRDGVVMKYIGSFLVVNSRNAVEFLEEWVREIEHLYEIRAIPAHETPALCRTIERYKHRLRIGVLPESVVSCDRACEDGTLLIHMKSNAAGLHSAESSFFQRVHAVKNYSPEKILTYL